MYAVKAHDPKQEVIEITDRILEQNQQVLAMNNTILRYLTQLHVEVSPPYPGPIINGAEMTEEVLERLREIGRRSGVVGGTPNKGMDPDQKDAGEN